MAGEPHQIARTVGQRWQLIVGNREFDRVCDTGFLHVEYMEHIKICTMSNLNNLDDLEMGNSTWRAPGLDRPWPTSLGARQEICPVGFRRDDFAVQGLD